MKKLKIGIVCFPTFGGSGVVATELGKALAEKGHSVHFITYAQPVRLGSMRKNIYYHEVRVSDYPLFDFPPYELALTSKLVDVVTHEKLDLLHVHYAIPHASAAVFAKNILKGSGIHIPVVSTLHGTDITLVGKDPSFEPVISYAINSVDVVTCVSESLKNDTYKHFKVNREIDVVPNFVEMDKIQSATKSAVELRSSFASPEEKVLVHISNFRPVKRVDDVAKIFAQVRKCIPSKLLLVGDGPDRNKIEMMCRDLGICGDVHFLGKLKNPTEALHISDLFLLPSESESFGLSALEAMSVGVPVIATNTGGLPEVVEDGVSGYLSALGDVDDMAKNAIKLLQDDALYQTLSDGALEKAKTFDLPLVLPLYEELYYRLVK
jgi:N-acetyl-alpha-D-glucosaminyl L-malate synthase BshA